MNIVPRTLKGFRDFLPKEVRKRNYVKNILKEVFESYGFEPLETPALEFEDVLLGKYGEEGDKLMYRFMDNGERRVALRYDQTVPLARVVAQYQNDLTMPFKRYQMQNVWRAENTQKGRFREFLQCDIDTVGSYSELADAEIIAVAYTSLQKLGFSDFKILVNDRTIFKEVTKGTIATIDKLQKIGRVKVVEEMVARGEYDTLENAEKVLIEIEQTTPTMWIAEVIKKAVSLGVPESFISFTPTLARGLDYYTSTIIEVEIRSYSTGSVGGGGRYNELINIFAPSKGSEKGSIPAVGFAFGFDRLIDAMTDANLFPKNLITTKVLVCAALPELEEQAIEIADHLRSNGINTETYLDSNAKLEKQIKYALKKGVEFLIVIRTTEIFQKEVLLKNLKTEKQSVVNTSLLVETIKNG